MASARMRPPSDVLSMVQDASARIIPQVVNRIIEHLPLDTRFLCHMVNSLFEEIADDAIDLMFAVPCSKHLLIDLDMGRMCATIEARATFLHFMLAEIEANLPNYVGLDAFHINIGDKEANHLLKQTAPKWTRLILRICQQTQSTLNSFGVITTIPNSSNYKIGQQLFGDDDDSSAKQLYMTIMKMPQLETLYMPMPDMKVLKALYPSAVKANKKNFNRKNCRAVNVNFLFCSSSHLTTPIDPQVMQQQAGPEGNSGIIEIRKIQSMIFKRLQRPFVVLSQQPPGDGAAAGAMADDDMPAPLNNNNAALPVSTSIFYANQPLVEVMYKQLIACPNADMMPVDLLFDLDLDGIILNLTKSTMLNGVIDEGAIVRKQALETCDRMHQQLLHLAATRPALIKTVKVLVHQESLQHLGKICDVQQVLKKLGQAIYETCSKLIVVVGADVELKDMWSLVQHWSAFRALSIEESAGPVHSKCQLHVLGVLEDMEVIHELLRLCAQYMWKKCSRKGAVYFDNVEELYQSLAWQIDQGKTVRVGTVTIGFLQRKR